MSPAATQSHSHSSSTSQGAPRIYDEEGDQLLEADRRADRVILLPAGDPREAGAARDRIRIQWGQMMLNDLLSRRYRTLVCGVNPDDNARGIIGELAAVVPTSQWNPETITQYARTFSRNMAHDEVLVLKYDMDLIEVLALLRPPGRDHFTLDDLKRGFRKVAQMVESRYDRLPVASVSFLGAKSNRLVDAKGKEPSFETVIRTMFEAGYRGDVYPSIAMWELAPTGVFASYPFPNALKVMRAGGF
jgi:hypothetical protein